MDIQEAGLIGLDWRESRENMPEGCTEVAPNIGLFAVMLAVQRG